MGLFWVWVLVAMIGCTAQEVEPSSEPAQSAALPNVPVAKNTQSAQLPERAEVPLYETSTLFYGVYLGGHKTGWMKVEMLPTGEHVTLKTHLEAKVGGMGKVSRVVLDESRTYHRTTEVLERLSFEQAAETGSVRVEATRASDGNLKLLINAGSAISSKVVSSTETLSHAVALRKLARDGVVGKQVVATQFDPSAMKTMRVEHTLVAAKNMVFGGVEIPILQIETNYPEMGVEETSWADATGKLMEARVGGFFTARLEPELQAKRETYTQDLLVSAVVKPPSPIEKPERLKSLRLKVVGFGKLRPPVSPRQKVSTDGDATILTLSKDGAIPALALPSKKTSEYQNATPFIQADNPQIMTVARKVLGDATTVDAAVARLVRFVYDHVKDSYVPSFSNALEALQSERGDCTEHSVLFVALARALNIPARVAVGVGYWPAGDGFGWHAWAEVQVNGVWYTVDPTWNQVNADATHIKLADGDPMQQARIVMLLGKLKILEVL